MTISEGLFSLSVILVILETEYLADPGQRAGSELWKT